MAEGIWNWITTFVLLTVVFLIITFAYYSKGTGIFTKIADQVLKQSNRFLPVEPKKELKQEEKLPQQVIDSQNKFVNSIKSNLGRQSKEKVCRIEIGALLPTDDFAIELSNLGNDINSKIRKAKSAEGYVALNKMTIENAKICMVNTENFYNCYLSPSRNCAGELYNNVDIVKINNKEIDAGKGIYKLANYMLKIDDNKFCFIPMHSGFLTYPGCDASKNSLDNDCLADITREIPLCSAKSEPEVITEKDRLPIAEFDRFVDFIKNLRSVNYNMLCRKNFFFDATKIGSGYYIYINPNGQIDLKFNKDGGKIIKRSDFAYIPFGILDSDYSKNTYFNNYDSFKDTLIISPAGDYSTSDKSVGVIQDTSIIAVSDENNRWFLTRPNIYISRQPACAS